MRHDTAAPRATAWLGALFNNPRLRVPLPGRAARVDASARRLESPPSARPRLRSVDALRGLVMALMVLDHCRDYFHASTFDPRDPSHPALFLTRWLTHFCAPTFVFLAGTAAHLYGGRVQSTAQLRRFLWTRGLWLVLLELTVVRVGWTFGLASPNVILQVIWAIGWSMVALACLVGLQRRWALAFGLLLVGGHNGLDHVTSAELGPLRWLWIALHESTTLHIEGVTVWALYPLMPWMGVMALGYALGPILSFEPTRRRRWLRALGLGALFGFVVVRALGGHGNAAAWVSRPDLLESALAFLSCEKYPPSLAYLGMTLGPALLVLGFIGEAEGAVTHWLSDIGRVPLFFYIAHIYVLHGLAWAWARLSLGEADWLLGAFPPNKPPAFGLSLPAIYALTLAVVIGLGTLSRRYARFRAGQRQWWWSYL